MSLYKKLEEQKYTVDIKHNTDTGNINMLFWSDCGKHGTHEILDEHELTTKELLDILQSNENSQLIAFEKRQLSQNKNDRKVLYYAAAVFIASAVLTFF